VPTLTGVTQLRRQVNRVRVNSLPAAEKAIYRECQDRLKGVINRTPLLTGDLRRTEHIEGPVRGAGDSVTFKIVAGSSTIDYAIYVHEDLTAYHPVGEAKYIENEINQNISGAGGRISATYSKELLNGV
jgi:hypothetical protein